MFRNAVRLLIKHKDLLELRIEEGSNIGTIIDLVSQATNMKSSDIRLFYDGQRLNRSDTTDSLGLSDGDTLEVFTEMLGGGWSPKENIYGDESKILDILQNDLVGDSDSSSEEEGEEILEASFSYSSTSYKAEDIFGSGNKLVMKNEQTTAIQSNEEINKDEMDVRMKKGDKIQENNHERIEVEDIISKNESKINGLKSDSMT